MRGTEFAELASFVAIAERGSFAQAAAALGVSTSTLSQSLRGLEERLGVRLLNRTTRSVALTEPGQRLFDQVYPALEQLRTATEAVRAFRERPAGTLRLNVGSLAALGAIGMFVSTLTEQPIGATIAILVLAVSSEIMDNIPQLEAIHRYLPTHYWLAFGDLLRDPIAIDRAVPGVISALAYVAIFGTAAWARFGGKGYAEARRTHDAAYERRTGLTRLARGITVHDTGTAFGGRLRNSPRSVA